MAAIIVSTWNYARSDNNEVMVPAPSIKGNAMGTIDALSGASSLYKVKPNIISMAKKKRINDPAKAKE